jgi:hypothetical protein
MSFSYFFLFFCNNPNVYILVLDVPRHRIVAESGHILYYLELYMDHFKKLSTTVAKQVNFWY